MNWPILALSFVGAIVGACVSILLIKDVTYLCAFICLGSVLFIVFFLPFYFSNMEVIYHRYEAYFKEGNKAAIEMIIARIQSNIELSEDERKDLEDSFKSDDLEEK